MEMMYIKMWVDIPINNSTISHKHQDFVGSNIKWDLNTKANKQVLYLSILKWISACMQEVMEKEKGRYIIKGRTVPTRSWTQYIYKRNIK